MSLEGWSVNADLMHIVSLAVSLSIFAWSAWAALAMFRPDPEPFDLVIALADTVAERVKSGLDYHNGRLSVTLELDDTDSWRITFDDQVDPVLAQGAEAVRSRVIAKFRAYNANSRKV